MKISERYVEGVLDYLRDGYGKGDRWAVLPSQRDSINAIQIHLFEDRQCAGGFARDMSARNGEAWEPVLLSGLLSYCTIRHDARPVKPVGADILLDLPSLKKETATGENLQVQVERVLGEAAPFGFNHSYEAEVRDEITVGKDFFCIKYPVISGEGKINIELLFSKRASDTYSLEKLRAHFRPKIMFVEEDLPLVKVLDSALAKTNWNEEKLYVDSQLNHALNYLANSGDMGNTAANLLMYKYFEGTKNEHCIRDLETLQEQYVKTIEAANPDPRLNWHHYINLIKGRSPGLANEDGTVQWYGLKANTLVQLHTSPVDEYYDTLSFYAFKEWLSPLTREKFLSSLLRGDEVLANMPTNSGVLPVRLWNTVDDTRRHLHMADLTTKMFIEEPFNKAALMKKNRFAPLQEDHAGRQNKLKR